MCIYIYISMHVYIYIYIYIIRTDRRTGIEKAEALGRGDKWGNVIHDPMIIVKGQMGK